MVPQAPLIPPLVLPEQRQRSPSLAPLASKTYEHHPCPERPRPASLNSTAESSCFPKVVSDDNPKEGEMVRRVEEMSRQLEALRVRSFRPFERDFTIDPPFSAKIMMEPVLGRFKMPQTELYDGKTDPLDHLQSFKALILLHRANDDVMCRAFPATLRKVARLWFSGLHTGSIHSFEQLSRLFMAHFIIVFDSIEARTI